MEGCGYLEAGDRLKTSQDLAQPQPRLLGGLRYPVESPTALSSTRPDDQIATDLIREATGRLTKGIRPGAVAGPAGTLRLPRDALLVGTREKIFDMGPLKAIPCHVEQIEQTNSSQRLRCARSEAAALLAAFDEDLEPKVLPAADAALALVRFEFPT